MGKWTTVVAVAVPGILLAGFGLPHPTDLTPSMAGTGGGPAMEQEGALSPLVERLFEVGDRLGAAGVPCLAAAALGLALGLALLAVARPAPAHTLAG